MNSKKCMLKLKVKSKMDNNEIQSAQKEITKPSFNDDDNSAPKDISIVDKSMKKLRYLSEVKFSYNTTQESLDHAKRTRILPTFIGVNVTYTPRMLEHPTKMIIKDQVRDMQQSVKTDVLLKLSEFTAKAILAVNKEMNDIVDHAEEQLTQAEQFEERNKFFKSAENLKIEFQEKLSAYKLNFQRKSRMGIRPKDKKFN